MQVSVASPYMRPYSYHEQDGAEERVKSGTKIVFPKIRNEINMAYILYHDTGLGLSEKQTQSLWSRKSHCTDYQRPRLST
jgi:hypothetical protein